LIMLNPQMWISEKVFVWFGQQEPYLPTLSKEPNEDLIVSLCFCRPSRSILASLCDTSWGLVQGGNNLEAG